MYQQSYCHVIYNIEIKNNNFEIPDQRKVMRELPDCGRKYVGEIGRQGQEPLFECLSDCEEFLLEILVY